MNSIMNIFNQNSETGTTVLEAPSTFPGNSSESLLQCFEPPRLEKRAYGVYELNAKFEYGYSADFDQNLVNKHNLPSFEQESEIDSIITNSSSAQLSNLDKQPLTKRLINVYYENGLLGVFEELQSLNTARTSTHTIPKFIVNGAGIVVKIVDFAYAPINPWFLPVTEFDINNLKGEEWKQSSVRLLQWHPHLNKYAVVMSNDIVKVYGKNVAPVVLKHQKQTNVSCLAWKPFYSSLLAIGCAERIIIWDTESLPISIKPASSCSFVLSRRYHRDITDLQWYPKSHFLLSISSKDNQILIWDITMKECIPIKRVGTVGFGLARFSPNGERLFTADLTTTFRVWNPINYSSEKWTNLVSRCNSACWSPDGTLLLFSCHNCPLIYSLRFLSNNKQELMIACDLSSINIQDQIKSEDATGQESMTIGGDIKEICWDPTGQRLAVSFKNNAFQSSVIATFITKIHPKLQILPCGIITNWDRAFPASISFKPVFNDGALLTITWSNSRIQHVPFYFDKLSHEETRLNRKVTNLAFLP